MESEVVAVWFPAAFEVFMIIELGHECGHAIQLRENYFIVVFHAAFDIIGLDRHDGKGIMNGRRSFQLFNAIGFPVGLSFNLALTSFGVIDRHRVLQLLNSALKAGV